MKLQTGLMLAIVLTLQVGVAEAKNNLAQTQNEDEISLHVSDIDNTQYFANDLERLTIKKNEVVDFGYFDLKVSTFEFYDVNKSAVSGLNSVKNKTLTVKIKSKLYRVDDVGWSLFMFLNNSVLLNQERTFELLYSQRNIESRERCQKLE